MPGVLEHRYGEYGGRRRTNLRTHGELSPLKSGGTGVGLSNYGWDERPYDVMGIIQHLTSEQAPNP